MGSKRFETLSALVREELRLEVRCGCGHRAVLDPRALMAKGLPGHFRQLAVKLVCAVCLRRAPGLGPSAAAVSAPVRSDRDVARLRARHRG